MYPVEPEFPIMPNSPAEIPLPDLPGSITVGPNGSL